ncbi:MAG TPA: galactokinase family protein [Gemmatimonadaceae bacterium]
MSDGESERKATRFDQLTQELRRLSGAASATPGESFAFWVPGRIEVLGKHTDYGGGRSLLCAVERGICVVATPSDRRSSSTHPTNWVRVRDVNSGETAEFELASDVVSCPGHWSNYPITVARRIASNFGNANLGADIVFASDLPLAAGVSSSSALVVAIFLTLSAVNDLPSRVEYRDNIHTPEDLAGYLGCVENGLDFKTLRGHAGVGTFGGSEDQTAILCARANCLVQYSFCPVTFERSIALPAGRTFVIAASGVLAEKTGAALGHYNRVSRRLSAGLECWRRATGRADTSMGAAIASSADAHDRIREVLRAATDAEYSSESLLQRFEQFDVETNTLIPAAGEALANNDLAVFGDLVAQSQRGAESGLGNQIAETVALVQEAHKLGAFAASAFGGGFGGSVWALVASASVEEFRHTWAGAYHEAFPQHARHSAFFGTRAGPAAIRL